MAKKIIIKRQPVESSHVQSIGYDKDSRILEVEFRKPAGTVWRYSPVSEEAWVDLQAADSVGKWLHANVKDNSTVDAKNVS